MFDTSRLLVEINKERRSNILDDTRATPCPKMLPLEVAYAYGGIPLQGPTIGTLDLPLVTITGGSRRRNNICNLKLEHCK
jgi:hypothetical protein